MNMIPQRLTKALSLFFINSKYIIHRLHGSIILRTANGSLKIYYSYKSEKHTQKPMFDCNPKGQGLGARTAC